VESESIFCEAVFWVWRKSGGKTRANRLNLVRGLKKALEGIIESSAKGESGLEK